MREAERDVFQPSPPSVTLGNVDACLGKIGPCTYRADSLHFTIGLAKPLVYIGVPQADLLLPGASAPQLDGFRRLGVFRKVGFGAVRRGGRAGEDRRAIRSPLACRRMATAVLYVRKRPQGFGRDAQDRGAGSRKAARVAARRGSDPPDGGQRDQVDGRPCAKGRAAEGFTDTFAVFYYDLFHRRAAAASQGLRLLTSPPGGTLLDVLPRRKTVQPPNAARGRGLPQARGRSIWSARNGAFRSCRDWRGVQGQFPAYRSIDLEAVPRRTICPCPISSDAGHRPAAGKAIAGRAFQRRSPSPKAPCANPVSRIRARPHSSPGDQGPQAAQVRPLPGRFRTTKAGPRSRPAVDSATAMVSLVGADAADVVAVMADGRRLIAPRLSARNP